MVTDPHSSLEECGFFIYIKFCQACSAAKEVSGLQDLPSDIFPSKE